MDATELLKKDHDAVRELFQRFRGGGGITGLVNRVTGNTPDGRQRRATMQKICRELETHTRIEEQIFYPAVRALGDGELNQQVDEAVREHATVKEQIASLRAVRGDEEDLDSRANSLEQCVEHHATEEENEMFPRLRELMPEQQRKQLGARLRAAKGGARGRTAAKAAPAKRKASGGSAKSASHARTRSKAANARHGGARRTTATPKAKRGKQTKRARGGRR